MCKRTGHRVPAKTVVLKYLRAGFSAQTGMTDQSPTKRLFCGLPILLVLLLEFEIQCRAFNLAALFIAQLQLHFIAEQAAVELERAAAAFVTEHLG